MDKNSGQKTVVVLGAPRSGTSLTAGILHTIGVNMGKKLVEADPYNPRGYFEDEDFVNLNREILKKAGGSWEMPPAEEKIRETIKSSEFKIINLLESKKAQGDKVWGWKDPRTILLLDIYLSHLRNPYLVICFRDYYNVARSIKEGWAIELENGLRLANLYYTKIINCLKNYPNIKKIFITHDDTIKSPVLTSQKIAKFIEFPLTKEKEQKVYQLIVPKKKIEKERVRAQKDIEKELRQHIFKLEQQIKDIYSSRGWKIISTAHKIRKTLPFLKNL